MKLSKINICTDIVYKILRRTAGQHLEQIWMDYFILKWKDLTTIIREQAQDNHTGSRKSEEELFYHIG